MSVVAPEPRVAARPKAEKIPSPELAPAPMPTSTEPTTEAPAPAVGLDGWLLWITMLSIVTLSMLAWKDLFLGLFRIGR
jgi:hypothetical protein